MHPRAWKVNTCFCLNLFFTRPVRNGGRCHQLVPQPTLGFVAKKVTPNTFILLNQPRTARNTGPRPFELFFGRCLDEVVQLGVSGLDLHPVMKFLFKNYFFFNPQFVVCTGAYTAPEGHSLPHNSLATMRQCGVYTDTPTAHTREPTGNHGHQPGSQDGRAKRTPTDRVRQRHHATHQTQTTTVVAQHLNTVGL